MHLTIDLFPSKKSLRVGPATKACFPAKQGKLHGVLGGSHFFCPISYDSNTLQNWITQHPKPKSPHRVHLLGRITGRISLRLIISHWAHEVDPLCNFFLKHQEITLRIQRNKRECRSLKCQKYLRRHKKSWRFTARFQQLTISRFSCF